MKKTISIFFAFAMILSLAFISDAISSNNSMSAQAQTRTGQVTVRRKRTGGVVGGTRYVAHKTKRAGKYVAHKTVRGTVYVGKKTVQGTRYTSHKVKRGTKATISRTKKILIGN
jgi:uncharacterized low-complexity protein